MRNLLSVIILISLTIPFSLIAQPKGDQKYRYEQDELGRQYLKRTIELGYDYEGRVTATVIKRADKINSKKAVLYVHGYVDYFFQTEMADKFIANGINFYAVDLRKYGRSILPHQKPFNVRNLDEYFPEIDSTLAIMKKEGNTDIILIGHSTGGLIVSLYAESKKWRLPVKGIILNSPFLDMNQRDFVESVAIPASSTLGLFTKETKIQQSINRVYGETIHKSKYGEWDFDTTKKMIQPPPVTTGWLRAIHKGQRKVHRGLHILCPILVMSSDVSSYFSTFNEFAMRSDAVLDVKDIQKYSTRLGTNVKMVVIPGGMHDLILSSKPVRENVYDEIFKWTKEVF